jgi:hypothetical protein
MALVMLRCRLRLSMGSCGKRRPNCDGWLRFWLVGIPLLLLALPKLGVFLPIQLFQTLRLLFDLRLTSLCLLLLFLQQLLGPLLQLLFPFTTLAGLRLRLLF